MENLIGSVCLLEPGHAQICWTAYGFAVLESNTHIWFYDLWAQSLDK
jgi:hypothetical protein